MARPLARLRSTSLELPRFTAPATPDVRALVTESGSQYTVGHPMEPEWDGEVAIRMGYYANTFVYAAVKANAEDLSAMPIRAGADMHKPANYNVRSPLAQLLGPPPGTPAPEITAEQLISWSVGQYRVTGRFAWELVWDQDRIVQVWPLPATRLRPIPSSDPRVFWQGFEYDTGKGYKYLPAKNVLYHWRPSLHDWRQPESALQASRLDISVMVMQDRYDYAFLKNDARPAAVVVHEQFGDVADRDVWRAQWNDTHQGPDNAGKVRFMEASPGGATPDMALAIHTVGLTQKDAEFIRRYEAKLRAITVALGTPLSRLGDATGRTFSNADREELNYWRHTIRPLAKDVAAAINLQVSPYVGNGKDVVWFDESGIAALQPPRRFADTDVPNMVAAGLISPNEGREMLGLERIDEDWADEYKPAPAPVVVAPPALPAAEDDEEPVEDVPAASEETVSAPPSQIRSYVAVQERSVELGQAQQETLERAWERAFTRLLNRQKATAVSRLTGKRGRQATRDDAVPNADGIFDRAFWLAETTEVATDMVEMTLATSAGNMRALIGTSLDLDSPWARAFIASRANLLAGQVTETTYRDINQAMQAGMTEGESIPALADRIRGLFDQTYRTRAETVARTEVISSYNGATWDIGQQYGTDVVAGYEWLAALDNRTRRSHQGAHGQISVGGQPFDVGGKQMRYPGDPAGGASECVNCRCTLAALTPDDMRDRGVDIETTDPTDPTEARFGGLMSQGAEGGWETVLRDAGRTFDDHDSWEALPEATREAVAAYRGSGYKKINRTLRGQIAPTPAIEGHIRELDRAFVDHGYTLTDDLVVTRQVDVEFAEDWKPGDTFIDHGYTSTAAKGHTANASSGIAELEILVPKGTRVLSMSQPESELLLNRGSAYRMLRTRDGRIQMIVEPPPALTERSASLPKDSGVAARMTWAEGDLQKVAARNDPWADLDAAISLAATV